MPTLFLPEDSGYGKNLRNSGYIYYLFAVAVWGFVIIFLIIRLGAGKCGGYHSNPPELTKLSKATPAILIGMAGLIFLVGVVITFIGAQGYTNQLQKLLTVITDESQSLDDNLKETQVGLAYINKAKMKPPNETYAFNISNADGYLLDPLRESDLLLSSAANFRSFLDKQEDIYWWFPFFLFFGLAGISTLGFGYKRRLPSINFLLGIIFCVLGGLAFGISGLFYSEDIMVGDVCEQCYMVNELGKQPIYGKELGFYFSCLSNVLCGVLLIGSQEKGGESGV